jgi:hypothetical protein
MSHWGTQATTADLHGRIVVDRSGALVRIGAEADAPKKSNWAVAIVVGLMVGIVVLSPGARTYYKTGKLPG